MFQQQQNPQPRQLTRGLAIVTAAVLTALALGTGAGPAAARQDAGPAVAGVGHDDRCSLARVGTQYVRVRQQHRKRGAGTCMGSRAVSRPGATTVAPNPAWVRGYSSKRPAGGVETVAAHSC